MYFKFEYDATLPGIPFSPYPKQHVQLMVPLNVRLVLRLKNFPHLIVVKPAILVNIKTRMNTRSALANSAWLDFISRLHPQVVIPVPLECIKHQILLQY